MRKGIRRKPLRAHYQVQDRELLWFLFWRLWSGLNVQSGESSLKESFAICDFQCNLGVSSHAEELYWLAVLTEAASWSSLHLVSKGQEQGTVKERGWNKVRHRVAQGNLRIALQQISSQSTHVNLTSPGHTYTSWPSHYLVLTLFICFFYPIPIFLSVYFVSLFLLLCVRTTKVVWILDAADIFCSFN